MHDMSVQINPHFFSLRFSLFHRFADLVTSHYAKKIFTISKFSKNEIHRIYSRLKTEVEILPASWQHVQNINVDKSCMNKYGISNKPYIFSLGSQAKAKNIEWIIQAAKLNPNYNFIISGKAFREVFGNKVINNDINLKNLSFIGYASDEEIKFFMQNCLAFLFPSFYEGFGLPPLEALAFGVKHVIVSDIPVMHEIYENAVHYVNPHSNSICIDDVLNTEIKQPSNSILKKYSWRESAIKLLNSI
jgi:glycosyltransferase involved in cell wall biosynthesis